MDKGSDISGQITVFCDLINIGPFGYTQTDVSFPPFNLYNSIHARDPP